MAKKKYAMVALNTKQCDDGWHYRRVLISYKTKKVDGRLVNYSGTKFIAADPYFYSDTASHHYVFEDDCYKLTKVDHDNPAGLWYIFKADIFNERKYHNLKDLAIEFEARTVRDAIKTFNERNELR